MDLHQPLNSKPIRVLAVRYQNIPNVDEAQIIPKNMLTKAIQGGNLGFNNVTKQFSSSRPKCSVISINELPRDVMNNVLQGNFVV